MRRLAIGAAAIIVGYACIVGLISANAGAGEMGPPEIMPRPVWLAALLMLPAAIAVIGAWRSSRPPLVAAGIVCLAQSFLAFSGVTLPFVVPAILLLSLGAESSGEAVSRPALVGSIAVVALGVGAWVAVFALTEAVCWVARTAADGTLIYSLIPVSDTLAVGPVEVASGCDGGTVSIQGLALAGTLALGAIAIAELSSRRSEPVPPPGGPAGPLDVIRFNAIPFIFGPTVAVTAGLLALTPISTPVRLLLGATALAAAAIWLSALVAVVWVFRVGATRRWAWVEAAAARPARWVNVTTGFDDTTSTLRQLMPASQGDPVDVFDPTKGHESALMVARRRFQPAAPPHRTSDLAQTLGTVAYDAAFLLMSAHEAHGDDRDTMFAGIASALVPGGRLVLVEHLRDWPNRLAFGPGANHFQSRETWLSTAAGAGLVAIDEVRLTPYVRGFSFERRAALR